MTERADRPRGVSSRLTTGVVWLVGHASRFLPLLVIGIVVALTWQALRDIHPRERAGVAARDAGAVARRGGGGDARQHRRHGAVRRRRVRAHAHARGRALAVRRGRLRVEQLPHARPVRRVRPSASGCIAPPVEHTSDLETGVLSITIAFASGLVGWTLAASRCRRSALSLHPAVMARGGVRARLRRWSSRGASSPCASSGSTISTRARARAIGPAIDRLARLAARERWRSSRACARPALGVAAGRRRSGRSSSARRSAWRASCRAASAAATRSGSRTCRSSSSVAAAALVAYRLVYYIVPWAVASLVLLSWATRRASRRVELARRVVAGLVGAGGALILLSTASPALHVRLVTLEQIVPLPIVEVSHVAAALTGLLLLVLARGLAKGYRAALGATIFVLGLAARVGNPQGARLRGGARPLGASRSPRGRRRRSSTAPATARWLHGARPRGRRAGALPVPRLRHVRVPHHARFARTREVFRLPLRARPLPAHGRHAGDCGRRRRALRPAARARPLHAPRRGRDRPDARAARRRRPRDGRAARGQRRQVGVPIRRPRLLPLPHDRPVSRRVLRSGRRAPRGSRRAPDGALRLRRRDRPPAALLSGVARVDSAAARPRVRVLQAGRGSRRAARPPDARRPRRQDVPADPPARRTRPRCASGSSRPATSPPRFPS